MYWVYMCGHVHTMAHLWRSEDGLQESVLSFHSAGPLYSEPSFWIFESRWFLGILVRFALGTCCILSGKSRTTVSCWDTGEQWNHTSCQVSNWYPSSTHLLCYHVTFLKALKAVPESGSCFSTCGERSLWSGNMVMLPCLQNHIGSCFLRLMDTLDEIIEICHSAPGI